VSPSLNSKNSTCDLNQHVSHREQRVLSVRVKNTQRSLSRLCVSCSLIPTLLSLILYSCEYYIVSVYLKRSLINKSKLYRVYLCISLRGIDGLELPNHKAHPWVCTVGLPELALSYILTIFLFFLIFLTV